MAGATPVNILLGCHFKLSEGWAPMTEVEHALMLEVPYAWSWAA